MLELYYLKPVTMDRIRGSYLAGAIERYVAWMTVRKFSAHCVHARVPLIMRFGEFARRRGASDVQQLADHIDAFVRRELRKQPVRRRSRQAKRIYVASLRRPIEQLLRIALPERAANPRPMPLTRWAPGFFNYLREERGLREATIVLYRCELACFEGFVGRKGIDLPDRLSPSVFDEFFAERRLRVRASSMHGLCAALRSVLRYMFREGIMRRDLSSAVDGPRTYRLSEIPRCVSWDEVLRTLKRIDRRSAIGKRDYAIVLLLAVYGLRAREVAALTLDDIEWRGAALHIRGRKAGHATIYPLSTQLGEAIVDYVKNARPETESRRIFMVHRAPRRPVEGKIVSDLAGRHLKAAGVVAPRLGSHTLRHSVAQRLVDADFSLKVVGDYLGHRSQSSTAIYAKVSIESLREVALGDGEDIL